MKVQRFWQLAIFSILVLHVNPAPAAPLKVDLNYPDRKDGESRNCTNWTVAGGQSLTRDFDGVTVTFSATGASGSAIRSEWFKGGYDYDAKLVSDGLSASGGGTVQMTIAGLTAGKHSIATYHNALANPANSTFSKLNITLNGQPHVTGLAPSVRVLNNYDAPSAFFAVDVKQGETVTITFAGDGSGSNNDAVINGFEIDMVNPAIKAIKPVPSNDDMHANAENGTLNLSWTPAASAVSHDVYFGNDANAVGSAVSGAPEFKGNQPGTSLPVAGLNNLAEYFWRVDEVDASGGRTKGEVWCFRIRHLAFPTAEGYGRFSRGGRGGVVYTVTNLNDAGPGSFREAVEAEGPRTIVFDVSGLIVLKNRLGLRNSYCTIAGQTAPGQGICISNYNFGMSGMNDAIIRYIRVRPGNTSGVTLDGMGMASSNHSIIDHCSISWTLDESFSSRGAKNITLQRTLIAEALNQAGHRNYPVGTQHGYAASIGGDVGSFHHNLLAHCSGRNWSLAGGINKNNELAGRLDIRNNVVYNWQNRTTDGGAHEVNFVNNYYKPGPATKLLKVLIPQFEGFDAHTVSLAPQRYYVLGNILEGHATADQRYAAVVSKPEMPYEYYTVPEQFFEPHVNTQTAQEAYEDVLDNVGCNRPAQDELDQRYIAETRTGTFKYRGSKTNLPGLPDSQEDVGGWPNYPQETRPANYDSDHDGMPDAWETARPYLDPKNPEDRNGDHDNDGYTNLEDYLNTLAGDIKDTRLARQ